MEIKEYWQERAKDNLSGTYADEILQDLEMESIGKYIKNGDKVLDVGCGKGLTANYLSKQKNIHIVGMDSSQNMIREAKQNYNLDFVVDDILNNNHLGQYDVVYTERCLINLPTWEYQQKAIYNISLKVKRGGLFVMLEGSKTGLDKLNEVRNAYELKPIEVVWHNLFFDESKLMDFIFKYFTLEKIDNFCSTYMLISRALYPALIKPEEPKYDALINKLAVQLPNEGSYGYQKIYVFRKI